jgi:hypothetical protein
MLKKKVRIKNGPKKTDIELLEEAIKQQNSEQAIQLIQKIDKKILENYADKEGETFLFKAAFEGLEIVVDKLIFKAPVLINKTDNSGKTPLHIAYNYKTAEVLIKKNPELVIIQDNNKQNFLHEAAYSHQVDFIKRAFEALSKNKNFNELINHCNKEGTSPLGMVFLKENFNHTNAIKITELFIKQKEFNVNAYLNNKNGMDCKTEGLLKTIGGFNILHIALINGYGEVLDALLNRNEQFGEENAEYRVNFRYPSLNPQHHMNSPVKILELHKGSKEIKQKLIKLQNHANKWDYDSGDSDNEEAPAHFYKQALLKIRETIDLYPPKEKREAKFDELDKQLNFSIKKEAELRREELLEQARQEKAQSLKSYKRRMKEINNKQYKTEQAKETQKTKAWNKALDIVKTDKSINNSINEEIVQPLTSYNNKLKGRYKKIIDLLNTNNDDEEDEHELLQHHKSIVIPHFHGIPFMQGQYTNQERREIAYKFFAFNTKSIENNEENNDITTGLHSRTSTASCGIENLYRLIKKSPDDLKSTDVVLSGLLSDYYKENQEEFLKAMVTYVYNFSDDPWEKEEKYNAEKDPMVKFWDIINEVSDEENNEVQNIVKYRFPFVSVSKTPKHPFEFAMGNRVETQSKGELPTYPKYDSSGFPKHRLCGLIFITLHSLEMIDQMEDGKQLVDMTKLLKGHKMKNQDYTEKETTRIDNQAEVTFFGGIDEKAVHLTIPLVYPNFAKIFQIGYHDKIWGLTEESYDHIKNQIWERPNTINIATNTYIRDGLINFINNACIAVASLKDYKLYYYSPINTIIPWQRHPESVQQDIMSYIRTGNGQNITNLNMNITDDSICKYISLKVINNQEERDLSGSDAGDDVSF